MKVNKDCVYCHGSGRIRHKQPAGLSDERWFEFQGFGHCPACAGWKRAGVVRFSDEAPPAMVLFVAAAQRTLVTCPDPACDEWLDVTAFIPPPGVAASNNVDATCPRGHRLLLSVVDA